MGGSVSTSCQRSCPAAPTTKVATTGNSPDYGDGATTAICSAAASTIVADAVCGHHVLTIDGYSRTKAVPTGQRIQSLPFSAGGYRWRINYYPNGDNPDNAAFISLVLQLEDTNAKDVKADAKFSLLAQPGQAPISTVSTGITNFSKKKGGVTIRRANLERLVNLTNDIVSIRCDITVIDGFRTEQAAPFVVVPVPPPDMHRHLGDLLLSRECADVTFEVGGETFAAHRCVLAARSPVFKAELCGSMEESTATAAIRIKEMEAEVFGALLSFVYTDTFPALEQQDEVAMSQHLLIAADRYGMERLKLMCEDKLCKHVDTDTVMSMLALADQHHCHGLKKACFEFVLRSPTNLDAVMATDGFDHLTTSYPVIVKELMSRLAASLQLQLNLGGSNKQLEDCRKIK